MIEIIRAEPHHTVGIVKVCSEAYWRTYADIFTADYIEKVINEFYNPERVLKEVTETGREWGGYFVAVEGGEVIGAGGGGMAAERIGELYVLYLDPDRRKEGIGTMLLEAITRQQRELYDAKEQWVSVQQGNTKGIPFYEAKGFIFKHERSSFGSDGRDAYVSLRYWRAL